MSSPPPIEQCFITFLAINLVLCGVSIIASALDRQMRKGVGWLLYSAFLLSVVVLAYDPTAWLGQIAYGGLGVAFLAACAWAFLGLAMPDRLPTGRALASRVSKFVDGDWDLPSAFGLSFVALYVAGFGPHASSSARALARTSLSEYLLLAGATAGAVVVLALMFVRLHGRGERVSRGAREA